jgi:hypothetical protein
MDEGVGAHLTIATTIYRDMGMTYCRREGRRKNSRSREREMSGRDLPGSRSPTQTSPRNYPGSCSKRARKSAKGDGIRSTDSLGVVCGALRAFPNGFELTFRRSRRRCSIRTRGGSARSVRFEVSAGREDRDQGQRPSAPDCLVSTCRASSQCACPHWLPRRRVRSTCLPVGRRGRTVQGEDGSQKLERLLTFFS